MAEAKLYGQNKGGMSINGIIKDYYAYARENISAGDLVEYINGVASKIDCGTSVDTQLSTESYTGRTISAVALDNNRVFIAHSYQSSYYLYGMVVTINGATIVCGTDTVLNNSTDSSAIISTCLLPNGNVFIAYNSTSNYYLYGMVATINGTSITHGESTSISRSRNAGSTISTMALDDSRVLIIHSMSSTYSLYGMVCTINGTTITAGTDTELSSIKYSGLTISICLLPNGNIFIAHSYNTSYYLYGMVISISGTTITAGTDKGIVTNTSNSGRYISAVALDDNRVFIAHSLNSNYHLYGIVCTISGTTISSNVNSDQKISETQYAGMKISAELLPNGNVFIAHSYSSSYYLYGVVCRISGTTITVGTDTAIINPTSEDGYYTGFEISSLLLNNGTIFVAHNKYNSPFYLYAQIFGVDESNVPTNHIITTDYETQIRKVTTGQFDGVAKTEGTGGDSTGHNDLVSIWTLE